MISHYISIAQHVQRPLYTWLPIKSHYLLALYWLCVIHVAISGRGKNMLNSNLDCFSLSPIGGRYTTTRDGVSHEKIPLFTTCFMLTNSYQLAQDFWEYIPAMTITDCCYFPLCLSYWCCPMISDDRRKFRSQISDNMDREEKKKEDQRRSKQRK